MKTTFQLGDITIHRIVEQQTGFRGARDFLPALTAEALDENRAWLAPEALDAEDRLILCFQSYIVRTPHHTVLVDSCIGNDKDRPARPTWHRKTDTAFIDGLAAIGLTVEDIDVVMCTHLHADHVGWNTRCRMAAGCPPSRAPATCSRRASWRTGPPRTRSPRSPPWWTACCPSSPPTAPI
jgi:glyoxylase-like metal-dependent hydrolase (beta-lactamase superfamily II)